MKHDPIASGKRKPLNLTVDDGIVAAARDAGLNLSRVLETALREEVRRTEERRWLAENKAAIESSNQWFAVNGLPYAHLRVR